MNTYRIYVANEDDFGNHTIDVEGYGIYHALERLKVISNNLGKVLAYELIKEGEQSDKRFTVETKPSVHSVR
jgi:hypothetical protein